MTSKIEHRDRRDAEGQHDCDLDAERNQRSRTDESATRWLRRCRDRRDASGAAATATAHDGTRRAGRRWRDRGRRNPSSAATEEPQIEHMEQPDAMTGGVERGAQAPPPEPRAGPPAHRPQRCRDCSASARSRPAVSAHGAARSPPTPPWSRTRPPRTAARARDLDRRVHKPMNRPRLGKSTAGALPALRAPAKHG